MIYTVSNYTPICIYLPPHFVLRCSFLWFLDTIFASPSHTVDNTSEIEGAADDLVLHTRKILGSSSSDQNHTVFLQVVPFSGDVRHARLARRQLYSSDFPLPRVGLLGSCSEHLRADSFELRRHVEKGRSGFSRSPCIFSATGLI